MFVAEEELVETEFGNGRGRPDTSDLAVAKVADMVE